MMTMNEIREDIRYIKKQITECQVEALRARRNSDAETENRWELKKCDLYFKLNELHDLCMDLEEKED